VPGQRKGLAAMMMTSAPKQQWTKTSKGMATLMAHHQAAPPPQAPDSAGAKKRAGNDDGVSSGGSKQHKRQKTSCDGPEIKMRTSSTTLNKRIASAAPRKSRKGFPPSSAEPEMTDHLMVSQLIHSQAAKKMRKPLAFATRPMPSAVALAAAVAAQQSQQAALPERNDPEEQVQDSRKQGAERAIFLCFEKGGWLSHPSSVILLFPSCCSLKNAATTTASTVTTAPPQALGHEKQGLHRGGRDSD